MIFLYKYELIFNPSFRLLQTYLSINPSSRLLQTHLSINPSSRLLQTYLSIYPSFRLLQTHLFINPSSRLLQTYLSINPSFRLLQTHLFINHSSILFWKIDLKAFSSSLVLSMNKTFFKSYIIPPLELMLDYIGLNYCLLDTAQLNQCQEKMCQHPLWREDCEAGLYDRISFKKPLLRKQNNVKRFQWAKVHKDWKIGQTLLNWRIKVQNLWLK